jgi:hypothetical protein
LFVRADVNAEGAKACLIRKSAHRNKTKENPQDYDDTLGDVTMAATATTIGFLDENSFALMLVIVVSAVHHRHGQRRFYKRRCVSNFKLSRQGVDGEEFPNSKFLSGQEKLTPHFDFLRHLGTPTEKIASCTRFIV